MISLLCGWKQPPFVCNNNVSSRSRIHYHKPLKVNYRSFRLVTYRTLTGFILSNSRTTGLAERRSNSVLSCRIMSSQGEKEAWRKEVSYRFADWVVYRTRCLPCCTSSTPRSCRHSAACGECSSSPRRTPVDYGIIRVDYRLVHGTTV